MTSPYIPHTSIMKYSSLSKRRSRGSSMDSIRLFAGSCILIIVCGNLIMLQSYHSFIDRQSNHDPSLLDEESFDGISSSNREYELMRNKRAIPRDIFSEYASEFLPKIQNIGNVVQYSGIEGRIRKLMQENSNIKRLGVTNSNILRMKVDQFLTAQKIDKSGDDNRNSNDMLTCADVDMLDNIHHIGSGWTKAVYRADLVGRNVAVKTVDVSGRSVSECVGQGLNMTDCYGKAAHKIIKEIVLLQALKHEHIIKVLGYCVPDKPFDGDVDTTIAMVTELGEPIDQIKLLQMSWEDRLRVSYDLTKLIAYLAKTSYGSVSLNDFRRTQFILVNGSLKLSDVDDAGFGDPVCHHDSSCIIDLGKENITKVLRCVEGVCKGYNEYMNILKTGRHFTSFLLPHGAPKSLRPLLDKIVDHFDNLTRNAKGLVKDLEKVVSLYESGAYLGRPKNNIKTAYKFHHKSDFPGQFDYRCRFSMSSSSCTVAVFDLQEAEEVCDYDEECKGFVWSHRKTWTGRTLVHFKNGIGKMAVNEKTDLYLKPS